MTNVPKRQSHTKLLNIKYQFFRKYVEVGTLHVLHIPGEEQMTDIFTKPFEDTTFMKRRYAVSGDKYNVI